MQFDIIRVIVFDDPTPLESAMRHKSWQIAAISDAWSGRMLIMRYKEHSIKVWHRPDGVVEFEVDDILINPEADTKVGRFVRSLLPASALAAKGAA